MNVHYFNDNVTVFLDSRMKGNFIEIYFYFLIIVLT